MRIAVSGTHCSGKSTLIEDFLAVHRDYLHEPEPYEWLDEADTGDFHRQLEISIERWREHAPGARVIGERCPLDFVAYLRALGETADLEGIESMDHIDLLVVLPLNEADGIEAPGDEDPELREAMNEHLLALLAEVEGPRVVEITGSRRQRLARLETAAVHSSPPCSSKT